MDILLRFEIYFKSKKNLFAYNLFTLKINKLKGNLSSKVLM